jgi:hypothetical protein
MVSVVGTLVYINDFSVGISGGKVININTSYRHLAILPTGG